MTPVRPNGSHERVMFSDDVLIISRVLEFYNQCNLDHPTPSITILGSEEERQLLLTAGAEMAAAGANHKALAWFGVRWLTANDARSSLAGIRELGLPVFTSPTAQELAEGDHLLSSLFPRKMSGVQRRLTMAFDRTYLQGCSQLCETTRGNTLVGGPHRPLDFILPDEAQLLLRDSDGNVTEQQVSRAREKATEVESVTVWDTTRPHSNIYELAAWPVLPGASKNKQFEEKASNPKLQRGLFECLSRIGAALQYADSIKFTIG